MLTARRSHHASRRLRLVAAVAAAAAAFVAAPSGAAAATAHTTYYSLDMQAPSSAGPSLFLTAKSTGRVMLEPYQSGELRQQWTPVYPTFPRVPDVTGSGPLTDFLGAVGSCIAGAVTSGGCPFHGATGTPRKFVNRMYAMCLTFSVPGEAFYVRVKPCGRDAKANIPQTFAWRYTDAEVAGGVPSAYTSVLGVRGGKGRCLNGKYDRHLPTTEVDSEPCRNPQPFNQAFRFLQTADLTCTLVVASGLCGLGAPLQ